MKILNQVKQHEINTIIASDPEIKEMRKKIEASYLSKERSKQQAEKQVKTLESKILESQLEAMMIEKAQLEEKRKM